MRKQNIMKKPLFHQFPPVGNRFPSSACSASSAPSAALSWTDPNNPQKPTKRAAKRELFRPVRQATRFVAQYIVKTQIRAMKHQNIMKKPLFSQLPPVGNRFVSSGCLPFPLRAAFARSLDQLNRPVFISRGEKTHFSARFFFSCNREHKVCDPYTW